jgi:hypothetical protein
MHRRPKEEKRMAGRRRRRQRPPQAVGHGRVRRPFLRVPTNHRRGGHGSGRRPPPPSSSFPSDPSLASILTPRRGKGHRGRQGSREREMGREWERRKREEIANQERGGGGSDGRGEERDISPLLTSSLLKVFLSRASLLPAFSPRSAVGSGPSTPSLSPPTFLPLFLSFQSTLG